MKIARRIALVIIFAFVVTLISGCSVKEKENLFSDWVAEDIEEIQIKKIQYTLTVADKNEINEFVKYLQGAVVINKEKTESTEGWTYAFSVRMKDGDVKSYTLDSSNIYWDYNKEYQNIYTVDTDYFKPLIDVLDAEYDANL